MNIYKYISVPVPLEAYEYFWHTTEGNMIKSNDKQSNVALSASRYAETVKVAEF